MEVVLGKGARECCRVKRTDGVRQPTREFLPDEGTILGTNALLQVIPATKAKKKI